VALLTASTSALILCSLLTTVEGDKKAAPAALYLTYAVRGVAFAARRVAPAALEWGPLLFLWGDSTHINVRMQKEFFVGSSFLCTLLLLWLVHVIGAGLMVCP